jgi:predicted GH43/DUF377 family glycosyl hydrolase
MHITMLSTIAWRLSPFKTDKGWSHNYHGVFKTTAGAIYHLGTVLHDLYDPAEIIGISD